MALPAPNGHDPSSVLPKGARGRGSPGGVGPTSDERHLAIKAFGFVESVALVPEAICKKVCQ